MTLNSTLNGQQLELESTINSEYQSLLNQNQDTLGRKFTNYRAPKIINGVLHAYCSLCKDYKPVSEFHKNSHRASGYQKECKECRKLYRNLAKKYPIPEGTLCAFKNCTELATDRDHDHDTGEFRAHLCNRHNALLGKAKDNINDLMDAIHYLLHQ